MVFFHLLKGATRRRRSFTHVQRYYYHLHLYEITMRRWQRHYQRRIEYQDILYEQYCRNTLSHILQTWRAYLHNKFSRVLAELHRWWYHRRLVIIWKQWRLIYDERKALQGYQMKWNHILIKYHYKHWKGYIKELKEQRKIVYSIYRLIFYRKYFKYWYDKVSILFELDFD